MSDNSTNVGNESNDTDKPGVVFKWNGNTYASKDVLEGEIATALSEALADWKMATVVCGEKTLAVRVEVAVLTGRGRPIGSKNAPKDGSAPKLTDTHYVAELADGTLAYRHVKDALTANVEAGNAGHVARLFAFNTKAGALYAIEHGTVTARPVAWETPAAAEVAS